MKKLFFIVFLLGVCSLQAQEVLLKGRVFQGEKPIEGALVSLDNKSVWTVSDAQGNFELTTKKGTFLLEISCVGYVTVRDKVALIDENVMQRDYELTTDVLGIDEVVVTGSKNPTLGRYSPIRVGVTSQKDLTATKSFTLLDGLNFQPGLRTENNCQNCGFTQLRINGLEGAYSQILMNGRPIFGSLNGIYGLEQIPAEMIKKIEVVRGGGSALYGSNAIAGTVNVITQNPTKNQYNIGSTMQLIEGKTADWINTVNGAVVSDNLSRGISFYGMYRNRNAYDANGDGFSEITRLRNRNFGFKLFNEFSSRKKIEAEANFGVEKRRGGNKFDLPEHQADVAESINSDVAGANINYEYVVPSLLHKFSVYGAYQANRSDNYYGAGQDPEGYGITKEKIAFAGLQHTALLSENRWQITSGAEWKNEDLSEQRLRTGVDKISQSAKSIGVFTQADWKATHFIKVLFGIRAEYVTANNLNKDVTAFNPRAGILWSITDKWQIRTSYARGFRAPLLYSEDVHSEMIPGEVRVVRIAPNIKKETSNSYSASLEYTSTTNHSQLQIVVEPFLTRLYNPFQYVDAGSDPITNLAIKEKQNGQAATVKGINAEVKYSLSSLLTLQWAATLQRGVFDQEYEPEDDITTNRILRSPDWYGSFIATLTPATSWTLNASAILTGPMYVPHLLRDQDPNTPNILKKTSSFVDVSFNATKEFAWENFRWELSAGVKNILNQYQKDFDKGEDRDPGYIYGPALPRTFLVGAKITF